MTTLREWSSDKAFGSETYAYTRAASRVMFDTRRDRRGLLRAVVSSPERITSAVAMEAERLRRAAARAESSDPHERLAAISSLHELGIRATKLQHASATLPAPPSHAPWGRRES